MDMLLECRAVWRRSPSPDTAPLRGLPGMHADAVSASAQAAGFVAFQHTGVLHILM